MKYYKIFFASLILFSCQEEITLDLPQAQNKLVVEGTIEAGYPPYVILTKNQGYFEAIDINTYDNIFVTDADTVMVWYYKENGIKEIRYLEKVETLDSLPPIYIDLEYFNLSNNYEFSKEGRTYYLEIKWNNQTITAQTTIPETTPLDCLWVEQSETADLDYKFDIRAIYSDPAEDENNILIKSKRLQHYTFNEDSCRSKSKPDFLLKLVDSGSDILINGQSFETYFPRPNKNGGFPSGRYNSSHTKECENGSVIEREKDIVLIKFCQIDEPSMKFWRGLVRQAGTNGNPFAEPMNLASNINGGFGVFTGYGAVYYKVPIVKDTSIFGTYTPNIEDIF
jgi:hypothetical protein